MATEHPGQALGIDIGGTGIKGALVDLADGSLVSERFRIDTPRPATPSAVVATAAKVAAHFDHSGPIGVTFPGVVRDGVVHSAANVDESWKGASLVDLLSPQVSGAVCALNDADAAGLAEVRHGAGRGHRGVVILVTLGTGIGTALIHDGRLVPNAELGHIEVDGHDAETRASASARERKDWTWEVWAEHVQTYLKTLENLLWPELFILGGGVSKKPDKWFPLLETRTEIVIASLANNAGIVGAALTAAESRARTARLRPDRRAARGQAPAPLH